MKTAKKRNILVCLLALFTLCVIGAVFHTAQTRQSSATGESYTLTFEDKRVPSKSLNEYFGVPTDSTTTPTREKYGENGIKITFSGVGKATINLGTEMGLEAGKTYVQTFKVKLDTVSTTEAFYLFPYASHFNNTEAPEAPTALDPVYKADKGKWEPNWFHYLNYKNETTWTNTFTYDGTNDSVFELVFTANSGRSGSIYIWDLTLTEVQTQTVENGAAIGTLPEVPAKDGYNKGYWTIDGTRITAETVYDYGMDKTAIAEHVQEYTLTFEDKRVPSKSLNEYSKVEGSATIEQYEESGIKITFSGTGEAKINLGTEMGLVAGKTYVQSFKVKLDTVSTTELFYLYPYALHFNNTEAPEAPTALDPINKGTKWEPNWFHYLNYKNETTWTNTFTYDGTNDSVFELVFTANSGRSGSIYIWDLTLTEVQTQTVENGNKATAPEAPEKAGTDDINYVFDGWYNGETKWDFDTPVTEDLTLTAKFNEVDSVGMVKTMEVLLNGKITVRFGVHLTQTTIDSIDNAGLNVTIGGTPQTLSANAATINDKGYYMFEVGIAAAQMTENIVLQVANGETVGNAKTVTVRQYADYMLSASAGDSAKTALIKAMLDYGAYAQVLFGVNTNNLANAGIHAAGEDPLAAVTTIDAATTTTGTATGATLNSQNLFLQDDCTLRLYYTLGDVSNYSATVTYTDLGGTVKTYNLEISVDTENSSIYYIDIPHIPAPMLDTVYSVTIKNTADNTFATTSISALSYAATVLNSEEASVNQQNAMKALYLYNVAANAYFNK